MNERQKALWKNVEKSLNEAVSITWDTCHKIYVLMDEEQHEQVIEYGYDPIIRVEDVDDALDTLKDWFGDSCGLRFIQAVKTVEGDPNEGFKSLIPQCEYDEDEDEDG